MGIWKDIKGILGLPDKSSATNKKMLVIDRDNNDELGYDDIPNVSMPTGTRGQMITYNSSNQPEATSKIVTGFSYLGNWNDTVTIGPLQPIITDTGNRLLIDGASTGAQGARGIRIFIRQDAPNGQYGLYVSDYSPNSSIDCIFLAKQFSNGYYIKADRFDVKGDGTIRSNSLSASKPVRTNSNKELVSEEFDYCRWRGSSTSDPSSPVAGDVYWNTNDSVLKMYNGSNWITIG